MTLPDDFRGAHGEEMVDLFGEADETVYAFVSAGLVTGAGDWNLADPNFLLGAFPLDINGEGSFSIQVPNLAILAGIQAHFQFGAKVVNSAAWGPGVLLSVPETIAIVN